ncbi:DUF6957 family protein [Pseudomonas avellanae]|uniref:DUF6957 family protein n=1 Tax=Pseudomonas avellanae TaxID=46257 RepID=UPI000462E3EA|nr:hypothetical protein [Pseudomonas avellanae]UQW68071.1 hypothetical protein L2Y00_22935 [Pseudomonas avellanae]GGJ47579.1 hypothetical protein GCM10009085_46450 [Pseudomonas avellanae]
MKLPRIADMLCLDGEPVSGASMASEVAIEKKLTLTAKPHCVVSAWILIDVVSLDPAITQGTHLMPTVMYAHHVLSHSSGQLSEGDSVMTGCATYMDPAGIFETADTVYILMSPGFRKSADIETVLAAQALANRMARVSFSASGFLKE